MDDLNPKEVVLAFLEQVRSGKNVAAAHHFLADPHLAHQVISGGQYAITRTSADYAQHVKAIQTTFGKFCLTVEEVLAEGNKVYVRWLQQGVHAADLFGIPPTFQPLCERSSAVYRVEQGKIVEYWIQVEADGIRRQLDNR